MQSKGDLLLFDNPFNCYNSESHFEQMMNNGIYVVDDDDVDADDKRTRIRRVE